MSASCPSRASEGRVYVRIASLVNLLIQPLETPPRIKVVPEIVEALDLLLGRIDVSKPRDRLDLGETGVEIEHMGEGLEEIKVLRL